MIRPDLPRSLPLCANPREVATSAAGSHPAIGGWRVHERRVPGGYRLPGSAMMADLRATIEVRALRLNATEFRTPMGRSEPPEAGPAGGHLAIRATDASPPPLALIAGSAGRVRTDQHTRSGG